MQGEPIPLKFAPQVVKDMTRRASELVYFDCDKVRFVSGYPQSIGGWTRLGTVALKGAPRSMFAWSTLAGQDLMGTGTYLKYYVWTSSTPTDITPIRASSTINNNPIETFIGETRVRITDTAHGAIANDFVTLSGASAVGGVGTALLNIEHQIVTFIDSNTYEITVSAAATSSATGGGAAVVAAYQINTGIDTTVLGFGWGAGGWGRNGWGDAADTATLGAQLRVWCEDNWGEDLLFHPRRQPIYYYDSSAGGRGTALTAAVGADDVPTSCDQIMVFSEERQALAFGCNEIGTAVHDPMFVRWSKTESIVIWDPTAAGSDAGGFRFSLGSDFMRAIKVRQGALAFTNTAAYVVQFIGSAGYAPRLVADKTSILGPKAANTLNGVGYWMATRGFWAYNGTLQQLPNDLSQYVYDNMNRTQRYKCHVSINPLFNEVWFHYPSASSSEVDSYVSMNTLDNTWAPGTFNRTAGLENGVFTQPRMADSAGLMYEHEVGASDLTTSAPATIGAYAETSIFAIGNGKTAMRVRTVWPDVGFLSSDAANPSVTLSMRFQNRPGSPSTLRSLGSVSKTLSTTIEEFTSKIDVGKRGRFMTMRIAATLPGVVWRWGVPHVDLISDGQK